MNPRYDDDGDDDVIPGLFFNAVDQNPERYGEIYGAFPLRGKLPSWIQEDSGNGPNMPLIEWDDRRYSTGIDRYDKQHKRLFEVLNELHDAMEEGRAEEELGDVLRELERYTEYHFSDEEEFMEGCGFAEDCSECFFGHQEMHEEFADKVTELREKHEAGEYITMEVLEFARDWLDSHIAGSEQDQSYGDYYSAEGDEYDFSSHDIDESVFQ